MSKTNKRGASTSQQAINNRANQLNPQNPGYHQSRGKNLAKATQLAQAQQTKNQSSKK